MTMMTYSKYVGERKENDEIFLDLPIEDLIVSLGFCSLFCINCFRYPSQNDCEGQEKGTFYFLGFCRGDSNEKEEINLSGDNYKPASLCVPCVSTQDLPFILSHLCCPCKIVNVRFWRELKFHILALKGI